MAEHKNYGIIEKGVIKKIQKETQISWKIPDIFAVVETEDYDTAYVSPSFSIDDVLVFFTLHPKSILNDEFMRLFLNIHSEKRFFLECKVSLKNSDGRMEFLANGFVDVEENEEDCDLENVIKRSEVVRRRFELAPQNAITIVCTLKWDVTDCIESISSDKEISPKLIRLDKLSENFKNLFGDKETCDTTLNVQGKEFKAHRSVLIARSTVFSATFRRDTLESKTGIIDIKDCDPDAFAVFLEYVYCGKLEEISDCIALNLYYISDKYDIQELKTFCVEYLRQHLTVENLCKVAVFADKYEETALLSEIQNFFNENASRVFLTSEWEYFLKTDNRLANKLLIGMSKVKLNG